MPLPHLPPLPSEERVPASAGGVILVVDDNEDNREMLARRLEPTGPVRVPGFDLEVGKQA